MKISLTDVLNMPIACLQNTDNNFHSFPACVITSGVARGGYKGAMPSQFLKIGKKFNWKTQ